MGAMVGFFEETSMQCGMVSRGLETEVEENEADLAAVEAGESRDAITSIAAEVPKNASLTAGMTRQRAREAAAAAAS